MKRIVLTYVLGLIATVSVFSQEGVSVKTKNRVTVEIEIAKHLDAWHKAAATADFNTYFNLMTSDAYFVGTDANEHWGIQAFKAYSKPYFDAGKAWDFTAIDRHIFINEDKKLAWFDELLKTQMGVCRGSGVMKFEDHQWKVAHYVLSVTVPNSKMGQVITLKQQDDQELIQQLMD